MNVYWDFTTVMRMQSALTLQMGSGVIVSMALLGMEWCACVSYIIFCLEVGVDSIDARV